MPHVEVDGLLFMFPDAWLTGKFDEWVFYRAQFSTMWDGIKAIDLLAVDPDQTAWFIEVKDYRLFPRTKPTELADEIAHKVFDTLAALLPAKTSASVLEEKSLAGAVLRARKIRVILHLEQPAKPSRLRPRAINPADLTLQLRIKLKPIDTHPFVAEKSNMGSLNWTVE